jgi:hypothetical protein
MSSSFRDTFRMLFCSSKHWLGRPLGSRRIPSLLGGANSEITRMSLVRRSTDPGQCHRSSAEDDRRGMIGKEEQRPPFGSPSHSSSLLSEPPPPDPPQSAKKPLFANGVADGVVAKCNNNNNNRGEDEPIITEQPMPLSPTGTLLGDTIFL